MERYSTFPLRRFGNGKFLASLVEMNEDESEGLPLVALVQLPNRRKVVIDSTGKNIGDWQGEWLRILGHPAGRVISEKKGEWNWVGPSGRFLSQWAFNFEGGVDLTFSGLEADQGYCRLVAAIWTWEIIQLLG